MNHNFSSKAQKILQASSDTRYLPYLTHTLSPIFPIFFSHLVLLYSYIIIIIFHFAIKKSFFCCLYNKNKYNSLYFLMGGSFYYKQRHIHTVHKTKIFLHERRDWDAIFRVLMCVCVCLCYASFFLLLHPEKLLNMLLLWYCLNVRVYPILLYILYK